jgi:hypothetical protein
MYCCAPYSRGYYGVARVPYYGGAYSYPYGGYGYGGYGYGYGGYGYGGYGYGGCGYGNPYGGF